MSNLYTNKLKGQNIGIVFGTFAPAHLGHYNTIIRAKRENNGCVVVVSGRKGDRGDQIGLSLQKRFRYMRELFADEENVYVTCVNEDEIPNYPDGWDQWYDIVYQAVLEATDALVPNQTWYVGEPEYKVELEKRFVKHEEGDFVLATQRVKLMDRSVLPISGTQVRENPLKYWNYITRPFRRHFSNNILLTGTASTGKTTLARDLARSFGSPFTEEYARKYEEESNIRDEELTANDFNYLASGMFSANKEAIQSPANNGLMFADSNVLTTKFYSRHYLTEEEHSKLTPIYDMMLEKEKWAMILIVPPVTKYVNDNFRDMSYSSDNERWKMHEMLMEELENAGLMDKVVLLDAKPEDVKEDPQGFQARYEQARTLVKDFAKNKYNVELI